MRQGDKSKIGVETSGRKKTGLAQSIKKTKIFLYSPKIKISK